MVLGDKNSIHRLLAVLFSWTQGTNKVTTRTRENSAENGVRKTINLHFTVILGATLHLNNTVELEVPVV